MLEKEFEVVVVDEFRTSKLCNKCNGQLVNHVVNQVKHHCLLVCPNCSQVRPLQPFFFSPLSSSSSLFLLWISSIIVPNIHSNKNSFQQSTTTTTPAFVQAPMSTISIPASTTSTTSIPLVKLQSHHLIIKEERKKENKN